MIIAFDTGLVAATNASVLILGARIVPAVDLPALAMFQLLVTTAVGLQRATLLTPALAAQRVSGSAAIPMRWLPRLGLPFALAASALIPFGVGSDSPFMQLAAVTFGVLAVAMVQDYLRYAAFSRQRPYVALASDATWLLLMAAVALSVVAMGRGWVALALGWGVAGLGAVAVASVGVARERTARITHVSLRETWRLGRWSGGDAALSAAANLVPMVVTTIALGSPVAAIYRILQTAAGPWNILSATFLTALGLDSWKLTTREALGSLRRRTWRAVAVLGVSAVVYYALAIPAISAVTGVSSPDLARVGIILTIGGVLGAVTIPFMSAASALGHQRIGLAVRVAVVATSLGLSAAAALGAHWIPWSDPIGTLALFSATAGLMGWALGYERATRREVAELGMTQGAGGHE